MVCMATVRQIAIRLTADDIALVEAVQAHSGHVSIADTFRFVLRQYAKANGIEAKRKRSAKPLP